MAIQSPARSSWRLSDGDRAKRSGDVPHEGPAERLASWVVVYLAALLTSLAVGGSVWAFGLM